jgi:hypothetical protein
MVVSREVTPALYVTRALGLLPFSRLNHETSPFVLSSSLKFRVLSIVVHSIFLSLYILHTYNTVCTLFHVISSHESSERLPAASSLATSIIGDIMDLANTVNALILVNYTCPIVENVLRSLNKCDKLLHVYVSTKLRTILISIFIVIKHTLKIIAFFMFLYDTSSDLRLAIQISACLFIGAELLLLVLCLEIRDHLRIINTHILSKRKRSFNLTEAYETLCSSQQILNEAFGLFLLFHLSQLFILVLKVLVVIAVSCVFHVNVPNIPLKDDQQCFTYFLQVLDGLIRFSLIVWGCNGVTKEVGSFESYNIICGEIKGTFRCGLKKPAYCFCLFFFFIDSSLNLS